MAAPQRAHTIATINAAFFILFFSDIIRLPNNAKIGAKVHRKY
jgi:hypothetical protein